MKICVPKETHPSENRVTLIPLNVKKLVDLGAEVFFQSGLGEGLHITDGEYEKAGGKAIANRDELFKNADIIARIRRPELEELEQYPEGCISVSYLDPFNNPKTLEKLNQKKITSISMEMIPRTTKAQKMDVLSSQASLAGYVAVTMAAEKLSKIFPMMMTPAGTISPSRVFIIGAGVAGLQAIATAKRMGARVEAFDTRPVVEEQVQSLGAKFVKIDLGDTGQTDGGYAKELTPEQIELQRQGMAKHCAQSDVVITTAQLFGRPAPLIVTEEMIAGMKPGSIIVDLAVETGGNVAGSKPGEIVDKNGVLIMGLGNLPGRVASHASQMYSANITNLLDEFWDTESKAFNLAFDDEIISGCVVTHDGQLVNEFIKSVLNK
ncbi:MAG: Re/Si-specific NAD(P)(+) transhydrogenase subunit alpha [Halobacteriovoraceae bacterium]|jgi:H+-translocating NAD(P) transhydrogenase subunit alpha|nr:Re/Si-specific NAD(P)(+) transhydrogenase subunit alpha [Halobacteriovoraceae bacterium]